MKSFMTNEFSWVLVSWTASSLSSRGPVAACIFGLLLLRTGHVPAMYRPAFLPAMVHGQ
jgi:hypothetical protein